MYNGLHTIPACDGRTDRRTDRQTDILWRHSPHYAYALRGKKVPVIPYDHTFEFLLRDTYA